MVVFSPCAQTVLPVTGYWFYNVKWKMPFVTCSPKNRDSEVVSFYICHMFESGLWHPRVYCERGFDFIKQWTARKLLNCWDWIGFFRSVKSDYLPFCMFSFDIAVPCTVDFVRFTELKHSRAKFVSVFISVKDSMWKFKCNSVACSRIYDSSCTP